MACEDCSGYCKNTCSGLCTTGCYTDCAINCAHGCKGSSCAITCEKGCKGTCEGDCKGTCTGACDTCTNTCKGTCAKIASLQLGGTKEIGWEELSSGQTIEIAAEDWNNVANGFKNYIKQAVQSTFPDDEEVEIDLVSSGKPITAKLYNQLFLTLNGNVPTQAQEKLNELIVYNDNGEEVGAIKDETIIRAEHFSIIGEIFNGWDILLE